MGAKEKMTELAETINAKTKEYAPIVKEKLLIAYNTSKDFTINVLIPKMKEEVEVLKTKIADFQAKKKAENIPPLNNTSTNTTTATTSDSMIDKTTDTITEENNRTNKHKKTL